MTVSQPELSIKALWSQLSSAKDELGPENKVDFKRATLIPQFNALVSLSAPVAIVLKDQKLKLCKLHGKQWEGMISNLGLES